MITGPRAKRQDSLCRNDVAERSEKCNVSVEINGSNNVVEIRNSVIECVL